jgi:hypothetical protein
VRTARGSTLHCYTDAAAAGEEGFHCRTPRDQDIGAPALGEAGNEVRSEETDPSGYHDAATSPEVGIVVQLTWPRCCTAANTLQRPQVRGQVG